MTFGQTINPEYDAALAEEVGADEYGMKKYVFVILKTGTNSTENKAFIDSCFAGHMQNMNIMVEAKQLIVAGPILKNDKSYRGIFILNATSLEEAEGILKTDPAVSSGLLDFEIFLWYGSAALPKYLEYSDKIWKTGM